MQDLHEKICTICVMTTTPSSNISTFQRVVEVGILSRLTVLDIVVSVSDILSSISDIVSVRK